MQELSHHILEKASALFGQLQELPLERRIETLNALRALLHAHSPFAHEPVDCVQWIPGDCLQANDYNPNAVAPPEMRLLEHSVRTDGFTQPVVVHRHDDGYVVVDGFHRQRIAKEVQDIRQRLSGHVPVAIIAPERSERGDRMAATIRHNRARGVHAVMPLMDIVTELLGSGWSDDQVAQELGMDDDEVRRFKQVSGLPQLFRDHPYSKAWE